MMNNKTVNNFRFKVKKPRQTAYQLDGLMAALRADGETETPEGRQRFSSEYLSMAKKFNIKMVGGIRSKDHSISSFSKEAGIRVKTEFSRSKARYQTR
jgi:hypothetical protein